MKRHDKIIIGGVVLAIAAFVLKGLVHQLSYNLFLR